MPLLCRFLCFLGKNRIRDAASLEQRTASIVDRDTLEDRAREMTLIRKQGIQDRNKRLECWGEQMSEATANPVPVATESVLQKRVRGSTPTATAKVREIGRSVCVCVWQ